MEYPTPGEIHVLHEQVVNANDETEPGIRTPRVIDSALVYISEGYFGERPETIHEKAAHLIRLIAAEHAYTDGNKRTALTSAARFYNKNGWELQPDDQIRGYLREFATNAESCDINEVITYLRDNVTETEWIILDKDDYEEGEEAKKFADEFIEENRELFDKLARE